MERKRNIQPTDESRRASTGTWRAAPAPLPAEIERRVSTRHEIDIAPGSESVRLVDLSMYGCCIGFAAATEYRPGQFIRLGFPGDGELVRAIVRWVEDLRIGAEFTRTLPSERIEAILGEDRSPLIGLL
jgi:hypothetical protein